MQILYTFFFDFLSFFRNRIRQQFKILWPMEYAGHKFDQAEYHRWNRKNRF